MNRLRLSLTILSLGIAAVACGEISDPTKGGDGPTATVSGALTGVSVPANAHVALVWRNANGPLAVGSDTAIVNGKFTMTLGTPQASYFFPYESKGYERLAGESSGGGEDSVTPSEPPSTDVPEPAPAPGGKSQAGKSKITPQDTVSGQITQPLSIAVAGFVVYVDSNGNGKLDLEGEYGSSPDQIIGGNDELLLAYLKDGGSLDYEKLRDKSGILPKAGYNLAWDRGRWLPLDLVELKIKKDIGLPGAVCELGGPSTTDPSPPIGTEPAPSTPPDRGGGSGSGGSYGGPKKGDPNVKCAPDGRSYEYTQPCPTPPPPPVGLCANNVGYATPGCVGGYGTALPPGEPVPADWPCDIPDVDGGAPIDGGADGGPADGGAPDAG